MGQKADQSRFERSDQKGQVQLSDISTIRDILMGQHIAQFEARFDALEKQLVDQGNQFSEQLRKLESATDQRLQDLAAKMEEQGSSLSKEINAVRQEFKGKLGQMLVAFGQGILGEE